ncbi:MAG: hypothetical protein GX335_10295 [Firmicutes bacterium]|nr:hypothetical protein [Bacillota bacterium]
MFEIIKSIKIIVISSLLLSAVMGRVSGAAEQQFLASHSYLKLEVDSVFSGVWIQSEKINIRRIGSEREPLQVGIGQIDQELVGYVFLKVNGGEPRELGSSWVTVLPRGVESGEIQILLKPGAIWLTPDTYSLYLESRTKDLVGIALDVLIKDYAAIRTITPRRISLEAVTGPGRYFMDEPIFIQVDANHQGWRLWISGGSLIHADSTNLNGEYKPAKLGVAVNDQEGIFRTLDQEENGDVGITLYPSDFQDGRAELYFAADVEWDHKAGRYQGVINVTLLSN